MKAVKSQDDAERYSSMTNTVKADKSRDDAERYSSPTQAVKADVLSPTNTVKAAVGGGDPFVCVAVHIRINDVCTTQCTVLHC